MICSDRDNHGYWCSHFTRLSKPNTTLQKALTASKQSTLPVIMMWGENNKEKQTKQKEKCVPHQRLVLLNNTSKTKVNQSCPGFHFTHTIKCLYSMSKVTLCFTSVISFFTSAICKKKMYPYLQFSYLSILKLKLLEIREKEKCNETLGLD